MNMSQQHRAACDKTKLLVYIASTPLPNQGDKATGSPHRELQCSVSFQCGTEIGSSATMGSLEWSVSLDSLCLTWVLLLRPTADRRAIMPHAVNDAEIHLVTTMSHAGTIAMPLQQVDRRLAQPDTIASSIRKGFATARRGDRRRASRMGASPPAETFGLSGSGSLGGRTPTLPSTCSARPAFWKRSFQPRLTWCSLSDQSPPFYRWTSLHRTRDLCTDHRKTSWPASIP
jgi:hypothetical protein